MVMGFIIALEQKSNILLSRRYFRNAFLPTLSEPEPFTKDILQTLLHLIDPKTQEANGKTPVMETRLAKYFAQTWGLELTHEIISKQHVTGIKNEDFPDCNSDGLCLVIRVLIDEGF